MSEWVALSDVASCVMRAVQEQRLRSLDTENAVAAATSQPE